MGVYTCGNGYVAVNGVTIAQSAEANITITSNPTAFGTYATKKNTGRLAGRRDATGSFRVYSDDAQRVQDILVEGMHYLFKIVDNEDDGNQIEGTFIVDSIDRGVPIEENQPAPVTVNISMSYRGDGTSDQLIEVSSV